MRLTAKAAPLSSHLSPSIRHVIAGNRKAGKKTVQADFAQPDEATPNRLETAASKVPKKAPVGASSSKARSATPMAADGHMRSKDEAPKGNRPRPRAKKLVGVF